MLGSHAVWNFWLWGGFPLTSFFKNNVIESFTNFPVLSMVSELLLLLKYTYIREELGENRKGGAESITYLAELLINGLVIAWSPCIPMGESMAQTVVRLRQIGQSFNETFTPSKKEQAVLFEKLPRHYNYIVYDVNLHDWLILILWSVRTCRGFPVWSVFWTWRNAPFVTNLKSLFIALTGVNKPSSFVQPWIFIALRPSRLSKAIFYSISEFETIFITYTSCPQFFSKINNREGNGWDADTRLRFSRIYRKYKERKKFCKKLENCINTSGSKCAIAISSV